MWTGVSTGHLNYLSVFSLQASSRMETFPRRGGADAGFLWRLQWNSATTVFAVFWCEGTGGKGWFGCC